MYEVFCHLVCTKPVGPVSFKRNRGYRLPINKAISGHLALWEWVTFWPFFWVVGGEAISKPNNVKSRAWENPPPPTSPTACPSAWMRTGWPPGTIPRAHATTFRQLVISPQGQSQSRLTTSFQTPPLGEGWKDDFIWSGWKLKFTFDVGLHLYRLLGRSFNHSRGLSLNSRNLES